MALSIPLPLNRPFIGISLSKDSYLKIKGMLPSPTYKSFLRSHDKSKIVLIFVLNGYVTSFKQYFWLSSIKLGLKDYLFVPIDFVDEYYIEGDSDTSTYLYSLGELSEAFNSKRINYAKNMFYPSEKKELYKMLIRQGKKLRQRRVLTKESLTGLALFMNHCLEDKFSNKEIHKKAIASYDYIHKNIDNFPQKLENKELRAVHLNNAKTTNEKQVKETRERINRALKEGDYLKPNGKTNKTTLAKALGLNRRTLDKYLK